MPRLAVLFGESASKIESSESGSDSSSPPLSMAAFVSLFACWDGDFECRQGFGLDFGLGSGCVVAELTPTSFFIPFHDGTLTLLGKVDDPIRSVFGKQAFAFSLAFATALGSRVHWVRLAIAQNIERSFWLHFG